MSAQRKATRRKPGARSTRAGKAKPGTPSGRGVARWIGKWVLLIVVAGFLIGIAAFAFGYTATDIPDPNKDFQTQTTFVYYNNGKTELGRFATQNRVNIPLAEVPKDVQNAVIAAEDRTFYSNKGIDPKGILRAAFSNASGNSTQGASTITQQYVKIFYLSRERTLTRKVKEAFLSLKIQRKESKAEILQGYLNTIYFGRSAYGIQAAAHAYFDKDAKELNLRQGAALAAILNSPNNLDPAEGKDAKDRLLGRYAYVLHGMADMDVIDTATADRAAERLPKFPKIKTTSKYGGQRGHVLTMVKKELRADGFSDSEIEGGGLRVTTTFTKKAMKSAAKAVADQRPPGLKQLHIAVASIDAKNGALRGMYAGQDYLKSQINWATAGGAPGSSFKPFALAAGIKDGFSLKSTFDGNSPYFFPGGTSKVVNEGGGDGNDYGSAISLLTATEQSVNTAYVDMTMSMKNGPQKIMDQAIAMGIPAKAPGLEPNSGISLGSATISPIDMANGYATIADGGQAHKWFTVAKVRSADGGNLFTAHPKQKRVMSADVAADVSYALQQVVRSGTGRNALDLGRPAAGKTGTATNAKGDVSSSWFVGYTPQLSTAVMYVRGKGNEALDGYMPSYFGADYPTRTWTATMAADLDGVPVEEFPPPANVPATSKVSGHSSVPTYTPPAPKYSAPPRTNEPSPTQSPTTKTPKPTPTQEPTPTPTPTPTPEPTPTPTPTPVLPAPSESGGLL